MIKTPFQILPMKKAIQLTKKCEAHKDVPVGCVIVDSKNRYISSGFNSCIRKNDPSAHAEVIAIKRACKKKKTLILDDVSLYVTLEPCLMCQTLINETRIKNVFFGAYNLSFRKKKMFKPFQKKLFLSESKYQFFGGFMEKECSIILKNFFCSLRKNTI